MKKLSLLIFLFASGVFTITAQTINITGTVSSAEEGIPLTGVTVQVKGTSTGTATDANGRYTLDVPLDATTLIFSFVGMKKQEVEIANRTVIDISMESEIQELREVMITSGYNIQQSSRSTSALTQVVTGEQLTVARQTNINNALTGKISGIQLRSQSSIALDRTGSVNLRGDGGFGTGNSVVFVVDGTILPNSGDLNMDDIEDITVLSGPSASAILGSRGANGAIIITTKKAKMSDDREMEIEINSGIMSSSIYILPEYQNEYAGGMGLEMMQYKWKEGDPVEWQSLDGKLYPDYSYDWSWGPRMEGQEYIPWYSWYPGTKYTGTTTSLVPQPGNVRDFYERGWTYNNNIAFSKAGDNYNIRAVIGNINVKGNIPGSSLKKTTLSLKTSFDLTKKLTFGANINFFSTLINGEFNDFYGNQSTGSFNMWFHRNLDMNILRELRGLRTPEGIYASWNHNLPTSYNPDNPKEFYAAYYWFNHYTFFDLIDLPSRSDRLFGDISLNYKIIEGLRAKITYRRQQANGWREEKYSTDLYISQLYAASDWGNPKAKGYYYTSSAYSIRENFESLISFNRKIKDITINAFAGSDFFNAIAKSNSANTVNGLVLPNLFTITNSVDQPEISNIRTKEKYRALFLRGDISFRDFLFGDFTLRNDWYSTLPSENNSVLSKSFGAAFVFSELLDLKFLNFGKIRASWGEIPTAIDVYSYPGFQYNVGLYKRFGNIMMTTPDQLIDPDIHGAVKTQKEFGIELRFINRIGLTVTYWDGSEKDIPYSVIIAGYSGNSSKYLNTGKINKKGLDLAFKVTPFASTNLTYELNTEFSYLIENKVEEIADGIDGFFAIDPFDNAIPCIYHATGKQWGELFGQGIKKSNGQPVLYPDGSFVIEEGKYFGSILPKITGGVQNTIRFLKHFTIIANLDYQIGGKFSSVSEFFGDIGGIYARTAGLNNKGNPTREPVEEGGGVHVVGVLENGEPFDDYVDAFDYFINIRPSVGDHYVFDMTYIKLREISIGYKMPIDMISKVSNKIRGLDISFICINPWLIYSGSKNFDPSEITLVSGEAGQFPGTRSFGLNFKINM